MKGDSYNYKAWIEKAEHDLEDAQRLLENDGYTDTICFHAQQAAEKYLKAYIIYRGKNPRSIHHLEELARDCSAFDKKFESLFDDCLLLTRYYIETRYPPLFPVNYSRKEAKEAIRTAEKIILFVEKNLK